MDETSLRDELERAVAGRPPTPHLVTNSVRAGRRLRRRRRIEAAAASVSAVAAVAILAPLLSGQSGPPGRHPGAAETTVRAQGMAYVLTQIDAATSEVTPVRLSTGTALKPLPIPGVAMAVAAAPGGKAVYVFSTPHNWIRDQKNYVTRVNAATGAVGKSVRLRGGLQEFEEVDIAPGGRYAYAIEDGTWPGSQDGTSSLVAINLATGAQSRLLYTASILVASPNGKMAYATTFAATRKTQVVPVDLASGTVLAPITIQGTVEDVAITPDGKTAYVLSFTRSTSPAHPGRVLLTPIYTASGTAGTAIPLPPRESGEQLAIGADGRTAYLSGGPSLIRVSLPSGTVLRPISLRSILGGYLYDVVISPRGPTGFAVPQMSWVQPFDLRSGTAESPVSLPSEYRTGFRTVTAPALNPSGTVFYVGATAYSAENVREDALIPVDMSAEEPGQPIPVTGLPEAVVIAG
jgi:DNA-binding beta-propeller fold protein YncE